MMLVRMLSARHLLCYAWAGALFWAMGRFFDPVTYPVIAVATLLIIPAYPLPYRQWIEHAQMQIATEESARNAKAAEDAKALEREAEPGADIPDDLSGLKDTDGKDD